MAYSNGNYIVTATDGEVVVPETGKPYARVSFHSDEHGGIDWYGYLSANSNDQPRRSTISGLRAAGWKGSSFEDGLDGLGSCKCTAVVEMEEYNGKTRARVRWVNRIGGAKKASDPAALKSLSTECRGLILESVPADDDLPF